MKTTIHPDYENETVTALSCVLFAAEKHGKAITQLSDPCFYFSVKLADSREIIKADPLFEYSLNPDEECILLEIEGAAADMLLNSVYESVHDALWDKHFKFEVFKLADELRYFTLDLCKHFGIERNIVVALKTYHLQWGGCYITKYLDRRQLFAGMFDKIDEVTA